MISYRSLYDRLPRQVRIRIRSFIPKSTRRWYAHRDTDVYLISYPKCGRSWLRLMTGKAISLHYSLPEEEKTLFLDGRKKLHPEVPKISVVHDDRPMLKTPAELETNKDKFRGKKVIFLVRDPRDVIVSSYFEAVKRGQMFGKNPYQTREAHFDGNLSEFIDRQHGGFDTILKFYNIWAENRSVPEGFLLVRYEDLKQDANGELERVLEFLGLENVSDETIDEAVYFGSFENMHRLEENGRFKSGILKPADKEDMDSYKTRKGKIGGYQDYLTEDEIRRLNAKMHQTLNSYYGYSIVL